MCTLRLHVACTFVIWFGTKNCCGCCVWPESTGHQFCVTAMKAGQVFGGRRGPLPSDSVATVPLAEKLAGRLTAFPQFYGSSFPPMYPACVHWLATIMQSSGGYMDVRWITGPLRCIHVSFPCISWKPTEERRCGDVCFERNYMSCFLERQVEQGLFLRQLDQLTVDFRSCMQIYSCVTGKDSCWVHNLTHKV